MKMEFNYYSDCEIALLKAEIEAQKKAGRTKINFAPIMKKLPGRSASALYGKARKLGFIDGRPSISERAIRQAVARAFRDDKAREAKLTDDERFQRFMGAAIRAGLERATFGIATDACTSRPRVVRAEPVNAYRSSIAACVELGEPVASAA